VPLVPPKIQIRRLTGVESVFDELGHDQGFEQRATLGMGAERGGILNTEQPGCQARIQEVET
jgi:hypothetical protein